AASGVLTIVSPKHRDTFGDTVLYAEPDEVVPLVSQLAADPARYRAQVAVSLRRVRELFGYQGFAARMHALGHADTGAGPQLAAPPAASGSQTGGRGSAPAGARLRSGHEPARGGAVPRRQLVMIAVVLAAVLGAALLIWRGEGLAGGFALIALAAIILLQMDARRRLSDLAADVRRNRAELRTAAARTSTQESELKELGRQLNVSARAAGKAREHTEAVVLDRLDQVEGLLAQQTED